MILMILWKIYFWREKMSAGKNERGRQDDLFDFLQSYELENNNS